jgi:ABC-type branched-subunit amino acid transport system substrate-binding protein
LATAGSIQSLSNPADPWTFQLNGRDDVRLADLLRIIIEEKKIKKIGMIVTNNAWGNAGRDVMVNLLKEKYGLAPAALEATEAGPLSLVPQILRIKNSGAEAVISWVYITDNPVVLKAMVEVNYKPLVLSDLSCTKSVINRTGVLPIHHISHSCWAWDNPEAMAVATRLEKFSGQDMKYEDTWAVPWNAMQILVEGLRKGNLSLDPKDIVTDRQKLRDAVEGIKDLPIIGGKPGTKISFSPTDHQGYKKEAFVNKETFNGTDWKMYKE